MTKRQLDVILGTNIREARILRGLSVDELAGLLGFTSGALGLMERGERGATTLTLSKLAIIFDKPVGDFFKPSQEEPMEEIQMRRKKVLSLISDFSNEDVSLITYIIRGVRQRNKCGSLA